VGNELIIGIGGPAGSGTSTAAQLLAEACGVEYWSGGNSVRSFLSHYGLGEGEIARLHELCPTLDRKVERRNREFALRCFQESVGGVLECRLVTEALWSIPFGVSILLLASPSVRHERIHRRYREKGIFKTLEEVAEETTRRDADDRERYWRKYRIEDYLAPNRYEHTIDTDCHVTPADCVSEIKRRLRLTG
jgi:cytidylate kinase